MSEAKLPGEPIKLEKMDLENFLENWWKRNLLNIAGKSKKNKSGYLKLGKKIE